MSEKFKFEKGKYYLVVSLDENEMDICTIGPWDKWNKQYDLTFLRPEMGLVSEDAMSINYRVIGEVPSPDIVERLNAQIMELENRLEEAEGELAYVRQIAHGTLSNMIGEKTIEDSKELELHHYHRGQIEKEWIKYFEKNPYRPAPTPGTETPDPDSEPRART